LKRFNNNLSKNNASVKLPSTLSLDGHCINKGSLAYELFAFVEHTGTARGGHYVAYSKRGNDWFYFSDGTVKGLSW
jgi:ubiquitin carboxyl-terminal hydrolase 16/45